MINVVLIDHEERAEIERIFNHYMKNYEKTYSHISQYNVVKDLIIKKIS